jgi:putative transposase
MRFIDTLYEKQRKNTFILHAFCLMDNHLHLMVSEGTEDIAKVMKRITVSYVYYFNQKYGRIGHLFQDRFRSEIVEENGYVLALTRYIHQNPLKAGMVQTVGDYQWSSYHSYLDTGVFGKLIETDTVLGLFSENRGVAKKLFKQYMNGHIRRDDLDTVVFTHLRKVTAFAQKHEDEFVKMVERKTRRSGEDTLRKNEKELFDGQARLNEIDRIINRLYEDKVVGDLSQERFAKMLVGFETEQTQIRTRCEQLRITIAEDKEASDSADRFVKLVRQFTNITELTTEIAATLIEKVIVSQAEKVDGQQRQEVRIIYNFIGDVSEEITE